MSRSEPAAAMNDDEARSPFRRDILIRFGHTDPAGIVFYPRAFDLTVQMMEDWFAAMGTDFARLHGTLRLGVPVVRLECDFMRPMRIGDVLAFSLALEKLGRSSFTMRIEAEHAGEPRLRARLACVCMSLDTHRAEPLPGDLRERMEAFRVDPSPDERPDSRPDETAEDAHP